MKRLMSAQTASKAAALASSKAVVVAAIATVVSFGCLISTAQAATSSWHVFGVTGPTNLPPATKEVQRIAVDATGGTFTLTFDGDTSSPIPFNADNSDVEAALDVLPSVADAGGDIAVAGGPGNAGAELPYFVTFGGEFAGMDVPQLGADGGNLSDGAAVTSTTTVPGTRIGAGYLSVIAINKGDAPSSGPVTMTIGPLPAGITTSGPAGQAIGDPASGGWTCDPGAGATTVTCTGSLIQTNSSNVRIPVPPAGAANAVQVPIQIDSSVAAVQSTVPVSVSGGGATEAAEGQIPVRLSFENAAAGIQMFWAGAFDADGRALTQAGGHPANGITAFAINTILTPTGRVVAAGDLRDVNVALPAGFLGNPAVTKRCPLRDPVCGAANGNQADPLAEVGVLHVLTSEFGNFWSPSGIYNNIPALGYPAQFTSQISVPKQGLVGSLRSDGDYGITVTAPNVASYLKAYGSVASFDGFPLGGEGKAFLTNPTECSGSAVTTFISVNSWQSSLLTDPLGSDSPQVTGCDLVPFEPSARVVPTSNTRDSASGLDVELGLPQDGLTDPNKLATSHLKKTVTRLPEGFSVNPSGATGLGACSDAQIALSSKAEVSCPDASKLGTATVTTPVLDESLTGEMYLGTPKSTDPASGEMLRLFLVVRNERYGLLVKLPGSAVADPETGRLTATFDNNPRVPFDDLEVKVRGGSRGMLAMPPRCSTAPGEYQPVSSFTPWSRAHLPAGNGPGAQDPVDIAENWVVNQDCAYGFNPGLDAGMSNPTARKGGTFSFEFTRPQGDQTLKGLTAELPTGLLASVKDVPLCSNVQANAGSCPTASRIGLVDASAGSGDPFVLEEKGDVYLTEGYKGGPYGLMVKVRAIAGPFRGDMELSPIVVRQKIEVDPTTAQVRAISDPFPTIWHGVPLRVRRVLVNIDRPGFMVNPSDCSPTQVRAAISSVEGTIANPTSPFQASGCKNLAFKPKLALRLTGKKQTRTGKHPGIKAKVTQAGVGEAGIEKAVVRLPKSLALDPDNAQALCEFDDGTKDDLENRCPKGSIVGRARATSPLLNDPLVGNVYFVKNVRIDPKTGNAIRTLPMIIVALRGEIAVNLKGESSTTNGGKLVNTFASVPDAPISQFNLNINGGKAGIVAVTRTRKARINLCAGRHVAETDMDGQNGRRHDTDVRMKTPCSKRQTKAAKRMAINASRSGSMN